MTTNEPCLEGCELKPFRGGILVPVHKVGCPNAGGPFVPRNADEYDRRSPERERRRRPITFDLTLTLTDERDGSDVFYGTTIDVYPDQLGAECDRLRDSMVNEVGRLGLSSGRSEA